MTNSILLAPVSKVKFPTTIELLENAYPGEKAVLEVVIPLLGALQASGGSPFLVGGYVRDILLGVSSKDIDIEVYGLSAERIKEIAEKHGETKEVGEAFGVLKLISPAGDIDISLPRTEEQTGSGHRGFSISTDPFLPMKTAMRRRDFTINTLMVDLFTGDIFDAYGGIADLQAGILRATDSEHFVEDPLRIMRAVQFASRLSFEIEPNTKALLKKMMPRLREISAERFFAEWEKLLTRSPKPSVGLRLVRELGIATLLYPEIQEIGPGAWEATLRRIDRMLSEMQEANTAFEDAMFLMFASLCLQMSDGGKNFLSTICASHSYTQKIPRLSSAFPDAKRLWQEKTRGGLSDSAYAGSIRRLARHLHPARLADLVLLLRFDGWPEASEHLLEKAGALEVLESIAPPLMSGSDWIVLGVRPGAHMRDLIALADQLRDEKGYDKTVLLARLPEEIADPSLVADLLRHLLNE